MPKDDIIFEAEDYRGKRVFFTRKKWDQKRHDHPELCKKAFLKCVKRTITNPEEVWEDYSDKSKLCFYRRYSQYSYCKVVIWDSDPCRVVTAYEIDRIKEENYPTLKQLK